MIITAWVACAVLLSFALALFIHGFFKIPSNRSALYIVIQGFKDAMRGCGFTTKKRYSVELYVWETMNDEDVCEDCIDRASWPPMDIADWFKSGAPGSDEAHTCCGKKCRCRLVPHQPANFFTKQSPKQ